MAKKLSIVLISLILNSCATVKTPIPISGSKADGTITLAYQYGEFEEPVIDWDSSNAKAKERCKAWGYHNAQPFGGSQSSCLAYNQYGCVQEQVTIMYQCS